MLQTLVETIDNDHGRLEIRRHTVCHVVDWLFSDRRYPGEPCFPHLAMIGMIQTRVERAGEIEYERATIYPQPSSTPKTFAQAVRAHWGIENGSTGSSMSSSTTTSPRLRTGHGPQNMAVVKHMAMNLVRTPRISTASRSDENLPISTPNTSKKLIRQKPLT